MSKFQFLDNAYWFIDTINNVCYIRTIYFETASNIIHKYDLITSQSEWNKDTILMNDYEDVIGAKLELQDIKRVSDFHSKILDRLGKGVWYFVTSRTLHFGIIRMYASYVNYFDGPTILVYRSHRDIKDKKLRDIFIQYRKESQNQETQESRVVLN